jgi:phosphatidylglycerophosphatase A
MSPTPRIAVLLATFGGVGYSPVASGTAGSLAAVAAAYAMVRLGLPIWSVGVAAAALFWPACWSAGMVEQRGGKADPKEVVVDEVVGQWLALAAIDLWRWEHWLGAFVLFRFFDVVKPYPIRRLERLPGGLGIVADDAAAGLCAMIVVTAWRWLALG